MMRRKMLCCLIVLGSAFGQGDDGIVVSSQGEMGRYRALLIGIEKYEHHGELQTPVDDVKRLRALLRSHYGFSQVDVLLDKAATRNAILQKLKQLGSALGPKDNLLIYFAGHGQLVRHPSDPNLRRSYWIPVDGDLSNEWTWVWAREIKSAIRWMKAKHVLLISDSCFSGSLNRDSKIHIDPDVMAGHYASLAKRVSRRIITSGGFRPVRDDGHDGLSIFAYYLIDALRTNPREHFEFLELYTKVYRGVSNETSQEQEPEEGVIDGAPDKGGRFVFVRREGKDDAGGAGLVEPGIPVPWSKPGDVEHVEGSLFRSGAPDRAEMVCVGTGKPRFPFGGKGKEEKRLDPFLMDRFEVTVARFKRFINDTGHLPENYWNADNYKDDDQPVVGVSLALARRFAAWAGKRLPTELEWEYAAAWDNEKREHLPFPWGAKFDQIELRRATKPPSVGLALELKDVSPWKVVGMGSGVREWCELVPRERNFGIVRGATQMSTGFRSRMDRETHYRPKRSMATRYTGNSIGFRCVMNLNRGG